MRIHTDALSDVFTAAAREAHVRFDVFSAHGSRSRDHAFEVKLFGSSFHRPNGGTRGGYLGDPDEHAATWDEWGIFLAHVFEIDPNARTPYYRGAEDFHHQTGDRFRTLAHADQHRRHHWDWSAPRMFKCTCGAVLRPSLVRA